MNKIKVSKIVLLLLCMVVLYLFLRSSEGDRVGSSKMEMQRMEAQIQAKKDLIQVDSPVIGQVIKSPLSISGKARGNWYFEASFPVILVDESGNRIMENFIMATDDWMTTEFVPFAKTLEFEKPAGVKYGYLILKKDNPSGLPENDNQIEIPVSFE